MNGATAFNRRIAATSSFPAQHRLRGAGGRESCDASAAHLVIDNDAAVTNLLRRESAFEGLAVDTVASGPED